MLDILQGHPRGWANPVNARASAVLPAAGAWDAAPTEFFCTGAKHALIHFTYTLGAAGGAFDWQLQTSAYSLAANAPAGAQAWATQSLYDPGALAAGVDTQSRAQREYVTYRATVAAVVESFVYGPVDLEGTVERMRIPARESGVTGTPGTLQITVTLY